MGDDMRDADRLAVVQDLWARLAKTTWTLRGNVRACARTRPLLRFLVVLPACPLSDTSGEHGLAQ